MDRPIIAAAILALACQLPAAHAEKPPKGERKRPDPNQMFAWKDTDGDGAISLAEFKAGMPEKAAAKADARFRKVDADNDGRITLTEFTTAMEQRPKPKQKDK